MSRIRKIILDNPTLNICACRLFYLIPAVLRNKRDYKKMFGEKLDFDNTETFAAEMIKRMSGSTYRDDLYIYTDKYLVREYIAQKLGEEYLVPLIGVYDSPKEIKWNELKDGTLLKTNNGSRFNIEYDSDNRKSYYRFLLKNWLKLDYSKFAGEMQYKRIEPKIIAEENIAKNKQKLREYSCYVFNNKVDFVFYHDGSGVKSELYKNKEKVDFTFNKHCKEAEAELSDFDEVIRCAEKVSKPFGFVRADFMVYEHRIYFSELTFSPRAGMAIFNPERFNYLYGEKLKNSPIIIKETPKNEKNY